MTFLAELNFLAHTHTPDSTFFTPSLSLTLPHRNRTAQHFFHAATSHESFRISNTWLG